jgi:3-carboxy-cis,cis-muconate cycloisomerase
VAFSCAVGVLIGTVGKVARDLGLLAQTEVAEASEAPEEGRGGSSSMPQKHNPVAAAVALAASVRAPGLVASLLSGMPQEHERGLGGWQAEWEVVPQLVVLAAGSARSIAGALEQLVVNTPRIAANLDADGGLLMAEAAVVRLAPLVGRREARAIVDAACARAHASRHGLAEALCGDPRVSAVWPPEAVRAALSPASYLGQAPAFVDRILEQWERGSANG